MEVTNYLIVHGRVIGESGPDGSRRGYDPKSRLVSDETSGANAHLYQYSYDSMDNRLTSTETKSEIQYTYDAATRLVTSSDGASYGYGRNGNLESVTGVGDPVAMEYDYENRLVRHDDGTDVAEYTYSADGLKRTEIGGTSMNTLIWDGIDYLGEKS